MPATADSMKILPRHVHRDGRHHLLRRADGQRPLPRFKMVAYTGGAMRVAGWRHPGRDRSRGPGCPSQARPSASGTTRCRASATPTRSASRPGSSSRRESSPRHARRQGGRRLQPERIPLAGLRRRERRGVRVHQGQPEGDGQRPGDHRPGERRPQRPRSARSVLWISAQTAAPARASPRLHKEPSVMADESNRPHPSATPRHRHRADARADPRRGAGRDGPHRRDPQSLRRQTHRASRPRPSATTAGTPPHRTRSLRASRPRSRPSRLRTPA